MPSKRAMFAKSFDLLRKQNEAHISLREKDLNKVEALEEGDALDEGEDLSCRRQEGYALEEG